jgi:peptidoglycan L-alanyl-D-glutamate endopeptidase CwlK
MPSRDLADLTPNMQEIFRALKLAYEDMFPDRQIIPICTYRSVEEQQTLYASGRSKPGPVLTNCDGIKNKSKHNLYPAQAVDVAILISGKAVWNDAYYSPLHDICAAIPGARWGGDFKSIHDNDHVEEAAITDGGK